MYPAPHGSSPGQYDEFPMQENSFSSRPINRGGGSYNTADPFDDSHTPYSDAMNQPLLHSPTPTPAGGFFDNSSSIGNNSGLHFAAPPSPSAHYGEAPRRQPRRYKTSKHE